ncbi:glycogen debranching enzyme-related protein [Lachnospiraceae bacterium KM106-2]|nr:glycogen debranching enzyme-related protein [Lachnospiraceae bacterium KM106-2]
MEEKYRLGRGFFRDTREGIEREWLVTNGIGGYANQSIIGSNTRNHSGYLNVSFNPPSDRYTVLNKTHEMLERKGYKYNLNTQSYISGEEEGYQYLTRFELDAVPSYIYTVDNVRIKKTIALEQKHNTVFICYEIDNGGEEVTFKITPEFTYKELGSTKHHSEIQFEQELDVKTLTLIPKENREHTIYFQMSDGIFFDRSLLPTSMATPDYIYSENELHTIDIRNGSNESDSSYTPYEVVVSIPEASTKRFFLRCSVEGFEHRDGFAVIEDCRKRREALMDQAGYQDSFARMLSFSADSFIVDRKSTGLKTILAGYPWFLDWGRDTMIAFTGLTLCTNRFEDAKDILRSFVRYEKDGLLPNVFPSFDKDKPWYNTMDASLWYFYAVYQYLNYTKSKSEETFVREELYPAMKRIIKAYQEGTHFQIHMDSDGLIQGGSNLDQITWMDVRVGDWVVTPRHGKPVEINALWYNALCIMSKLATMFGEDPCNYDKLAEQVKQSFTLKFWNEEKGCLYDVIEMNDNNEEIPDDKIRPNQLYALSLPFELLDKKKARSIMSIVSEQLYTPYGIRSLSNRDKEYKNKYIGPLSLRDGAYHMGTAWAYLSGAYISALTKTYDHSKEIIARANEMCHYFEDHLQDGCLNGIAEIFDGDYSSTSRGCYSQAWSVGEVLRAYTEDVLPYL